MLLYADDTTIGSAYAEGLQQALDALSDYCDKWSLRVNADQSSRLFKRKDSKNAYN